MTPTTGAQADPLAELLASLHPAPPGVPGRVWDKALAGPVREFLSRPGKKFRGRLVELSWRLAGRTDPVPPPLPLAVELLHAGSLIVDDIEDGSVHRRGRAALHRVVGLPLALNAGNWLYFRPLALVRGLGFPPETELAVLREAGEAVRRCHEGQALDLAARVGDLARDEVPALAATISEWKTGALMGLAAGLGATAAGADSARIEVLTRFGSRLGVGLQMQNDLAGLAGPGPHEDLLHGRVTWPWAWAADRLPPARFRALQVRSLRLAEDAAGGDELAPALRAVIGPTARDRVRGGLDAAYADLAEGIGPSPLLGEVRAELDRLEVRYD